MNILITGITGFIGKNLSLRLKELGYNVSGLVRSSSNKNHLLENNIDMLVFDGENIEEFLQSLKKGSFDIVIHLATLYLIENDSKDIKELINSNITLGTQLLELCSQAGIKSFINTSSFIQNYENRDYSPVNLYAATKQAFEDIGTYFGETGKINFITLSLVNSYGLGDPRKKIFNIWKESLEKDKIIESTSGEQYIDILFIDDVVNAYITLLHLIEEKGGKSFNNKKFAISSGEILKLKELSKIFEKVVGKKLNIEWGKLQHREREVMYPYNIGQKIPGWEAKISLETGIRKFLSL